MLRFVSRPFSAVAGVLAVSLAASALLTSASPVAAATHQVQIAGFAFQPGNLTVTVGDTLTWTNADDSPHTVTAEGGAFDSGNLDEGAAYSFTFDEAGTYTYRCDYHSEMQGTIVVVAAPAAPDAPAAPADRSPQSPKAEGQATGGAGGSGDQPDTALPAPFSIPGVSFVLWGLGLIVLAVTLLPSRRSTAVLDERLLGGWRR